MLTENVRAQLQADRKMLKQWLSGSRSIPLLLPRRDGYDVCAVLFPTLGSHVRFHVRCALMALIGRVPWSRVKVVLYRRMRMRIGRGVYIAPWVFFDAMFPSLIELEDGCFLGGGCKLLTHEKNHAGFRIGRVRVGANSVIGAFSIIRGGVRIGSDVTTGLGSVVGKDVPDGRTALGNPARVIRGEDADG